jgi:hypothetical protein
MALRALVWLASFIVAFVAAASAQLLSTTRDGSATAAKGQVVQRRSGSRTIPTRTLDQQVALRTSPSSLWPLASGEPLRLPPQTDYDRELRQADRAQAERLNNLRRAFGQSVVLALKEAKCLSFKERRYRKVQITARVESRATTALVSWSGEELGAQVVAGEPFTESEATCARSVLTGESTLTPGPKAPFATFGGTIVERLTLNQQALAESL